MSRDSRFDILFEPVTIGPVTARNRFYQVPHCNGMGHRYPMAIAESRRVKAEGGWAVIATEECEIHPTSDESPSVEARLWDASDIRALALSVEAVHNEGALAAVELTHNAHRSGNNYSRLPLMGVSDLVAGYNPNQAYAMSLREIREVRRMHVDAARRAVSAGFDIVYCYAGHDLALAQHFISRRHNRRSDEYGGSLENRVRFLREIIEDTREAVGNRAAVAVRFAVDELLGPAGIVSADEGHDVVEMLAELPDLWDVNVSDWSNDSITSRFGEEGSQVSVIEFVKRVTGKPVVGVGRFTSPDTMVSLVKRGVLDLIGAARPSIADPWLPRKIEEGRPEDIRECIGCNICVASDQSFHPLRCTQNPTTAEEYRRGWHPERIRPKHADERVLIIGAGPAGLEAAMSLGRRGYEVTLAEASSEAGGRATRESRLPGLATWRRVTDYRIGQIERMAGVSLHLESPLEASQVIEYAGELGISTVAVAAGSSWRRDGIGRRHWEPLPTDESIALLTPDDLLDGNGPSGRVLIYDDDHYYMAGVLAELLRQSGCEVNLVTPAADVSHWTHNTLEQEKIERRLYALGVTITPRHEILSLRSGVVSLRHLGSDRITDVACDHCVMVTSRMPHNALFHALDAIPGELAAAGIRRVVRIGDCLAPSTIAAAVYEGRRFAEEYELEEDIHRIPFKREIVHIN